MLQFPNNLYSGAYSALSSSRISCCRRIMYYAHLNHEISILSCFHQHITTIPIIFISAEIGGSFQNNNTNDNFFLEYRTKKCDVS
jgi:hypothetical protein